MWNDVVDLRDFYETRMGEVTRHLVRRKIRAIWPDLRGMSLLGLGYAVPFLRQFREEAERVVAIMPAQQGILPWPPEGPNCAALADETALPLPDVSVDRLLLVHGLECGEQTADMLKEMWRVLTGSGRILIVVPNRRGIWAQTDRTPFGQGHPYSATQLSKLLRANMFTPIQTQHALYVPPTRSLTILSTAPAWERIGARWLTALGGVTLMEAGKQIYAGTAVRAKRAKSPVVVPFPEGIRGAPGRSFFSTPTRK
jgi:SAM-dependent methyltransferase